MTDGETPLKGCYTCQVVFEETTIGGDECPRCGSDITTAYRTVPEGVDRESLVDVTFSEWAAAHDGDGREEGRQ